MNQAECQAFIANLREGNRKFFADLRGRGALRQLNQNFTHGWVYIAELLQNAIDEQARHIRFTIDDGNLVFEHDGRAFSEDNVRGLCSTGLSTKGAGTVGFMGVGFKSVFHAFERVDVSSADWRFYLQVGWSTGSSQYGERIRDWLGAVLPYWSDQAEAPTAGMTCRFVFSRRNDGQPAIAQDLHRVLQSDLSLLPLLARRGIRCLDWNDDAWELACEEAPAPKNGVRLFHISATQPGGAEARSWGLFVSEYEPTKASIQQFLEHRQIVPPDPGPERDRFYDEAARMRSVEAFFEVGPDAVPRLPDVGRAFAVLPMELLLPLRLHIQADWLLVVTRADPKNLDDDTPWHRQIREQIPRLLAAYIAWLVSGSRSAGWAAGFEVLPDFRRTDTAGGQWLLCDAFRAQLRGELATLPFLPTFEAQGFVTPEVGLFAPGPFMPLFDAAWLPNYLFGQRAVAWQQLPPRTVTALQELDLWQPLRPADLAAAGVSEWVTVWEEKRPIIMLLAALSEAGERCNDGWEMEPLVCVPTQAGGWRSHDTLMRLPSEWNLLGQERELADRLRQLAGSPEGLLQWELWQEVTTPTRDAAEMTQRNWARRYLEQIAQFGLESLVERLWQQLPEEPDAQQALDVLRLTWWVRKAQPNRKRYIQRLLCRTTNGRLRLLPPGQCLLAEPYGGAYRRVLFPDLPTVIADYLDDDPDVLSSEGDWSSFFAGLEPRPAGAFTLAYQIETYKYYELHAIGIMPPSTRASAYTVEHPIAGRLNNRQYKLIDAALPIGWPVGDPLDYDQAVAAVKWLRAAQAQLQRFNQLRLAYIPLGWSEAGEDRIESAIRRPLWVEQLQDQAWVPVRRIREVCLPVDVLTADDPARPEAPVADLPPDLIAVLTAVGITFGSNIARAPVVVRLAVEGPVAAPDELLSLLTDAVTTTETDPPARTQLLKLLLTTPLFPVAPDRTGERRKHGRFVLAAGRGSQRSDLGGWLTAIADFAPESPERAVLDMVHALIPFPAQTTGAQALAYLEDVWAAPPDADTVRRLLPMAYQYVLSDMIDDTDLHTRWNAVRTGAKAFVKQQGWLPVSEVYLNDLQGLSLPADVLAGYPCASPGHFGDTLEHRRWVARALGVRLLGEQITPLYDVGSVSLGLHHIRESLRAVRELVSAVRRLSRIQEDGTDENEAPGAADEYLALPVVYQASRLELTVSVGDEVRLRRRLSAILKDGSIYVTGRSHRYAGDLTAILVQLWRLSQRGELVAKIGPLLSLIDQPAIFQEELTVLLVSLGLAGEAAVEETAAGGGVQRAKTAQNDQTQEDEEAEDEEAEDEEAEDEEAEDEEPEDEELEDEEPEGDNPEQEHPTRRRGGPGGQRRIEGPPDGSGGSGGSADGAGGKGAAKKRQGGGSYTAATIDQRRAALLHRLEQLQGLEALPPQSENDEQHDNEADLPADAEYREAVIAYELAHGRHAVALDELQPGYDIESFDRPNGSPSRQLLRRIEVKGKGLSWTGAEVVTLTRRQFVDAIDHKPAESGWDFWLYVVQKNPGGGYTVWPIKNPARATARFELRAGAWTWLAEQEQAQAPADPDGHGIPPRFDTDETAE